MKAGPIPFPPQKLRKRTGTTYRRGYLAPRGKPWYGYYRKTVNDPATNELKSVRVPVILGQKSKMTKTEARQALEREITKQMGQPGSPTRIINDGSVTLGWFVYNRFIPLKEAGWKEETAKTKKLLIQLDIIEPLGDIPLVNFDKFSLHLHLNKLASTRSKDRVLQMRAYNHRRLYAGDPSERSIDDQLHQFGAAEVESGEPENTEAVVCNRSSRQ